MKWLMILSFLFLSCNRDYENLSVKYQKLSQTYDSLYENHLKVLDTLMQKKYMQKVTLLVIVHDSANYDSVPYFCIHSDSINIWKLLKSAE
jgi:hypothetical protein